MIPDAARWLRRAFVPDGLPVQLVFYVTSRCNAKCSHCLYGEQLNQPVEHELDLDEIETMARGLPPMVWVAFGGGEPFLRRDLADVAGVFFRHNRPHMLTIVTNGIQGERIEAVTREILARRGRSFVNVAVSLDGLEETHDRERGVPGNFRRCVDTLGRLRALRDSVPGFGFSTITTVHGRNADELPALERFIDEEIRPDNRGLNLVRGKPLDPSVLQVDLRAYRDAVERKRRDVASGRLPLQRWSMARLNAAKDRVLYREVERVARTGTFRAPCRAGRIQAVVYENGDVAACEILERKIGNLRDHGGDFPSLWFSDAAEALRREISERRCRCTWECAVNTNVLFGPRFWPELGLELASGGRRERPAPPRGPIPRSVTVLIPCRDEEAIIRRKIRNSLGLRFPDPERCEVLVVDDGSTDRSPARVDAEIAERSGGPLLRRVANRHASGKAGAIRTGLEEARGEVVLITDADVLIEREALPRALAWFEDPRTGVVCGEQAYCRQLPATPDAPGDASSPQGGALMDPPERHQRLYDRVMTGLRKIEGRIDSTFAVHGQMALFRREIPLSPRPGVAADDIDLSLQARRQGYRIRYAAGARFWEARPPSFAVTLRQKRRHGMALAQALWANRDMLGRPRYGAFGLLTLPFHWALPAGTAHRRGRQPGPGRGGSRGVPGPRTARPGRPGRRRRALEGGPRIPRDERADAGGDRVAPDGPGSNGPLGPRPGRLIPRGSGVPSPPPCGAEYNRESSAARAGERCRSPWRSPGLPKSLWSREVGSISILLVNLFYPEKHPTIGFPVNVESLVGDLEAEFGEGVAVTVLDMQQPGVTAQTVLKTARARRFDVVGVSVKTGQREIACEILDGLLAFPEQIRPRYLLVGGYRPRVYHEEFAEKYPQPEVLTCVGEGEPTLRAMVAHLRGEASLEAVPNLVYQRDGEILRTERRQHDLREWHPPGTSTLPFVLDVGGVVYLETSRGCSWGKCTFCSRKFSSGTKPSSVPVSKVAESWRALNQMGVRHVYCSDEDFLMNNHEHGRNLGEALIAAGVDLEFWVQTTVDGILGLGRASYSAVEPGVARRRDGEDAPPARIGPMAYEEGKQTLSTLQRAGLRRIFFGLESGSASQLLRYRKGVTAEEGAQGRPAVPGDRARRRGGHDSPGPPGLHGRARRHHRLRASERPASLGGEGPQPDVRAEGRGHVREDAPGRAARRRARPRHLPLSLHLRRPPGRADRRLDPSVESPRALRVHLRPATAGGRRSGQSGVGSLPVRAPPAGVRLPGPAGGGRRRRGRGDLRALHGGALRHRRRCMASVADGTMDDPNGFLQAAFDDSAAWQEQSDTADVLRL